ncbi:DUF3343 domain-containing protein [Clostridiaceae bacterium 35-E11]
MLYELEKYIIVFSSSYHCYYIESIFNSNGIKNTMRKAPRSIGKSCQTAIYISEADLDKALSLMKKVRIAYHSLYEIVQSGTQIYYKKVSA